MRVRKTSWAWECTYLVEVPETARYPIDGVLTIVPRYKHGDNLTTIMAPDLGPWPSGY